MKIKAKTKKIIVLSVMVVLLVATGVLNWALNDKLKTSSEPASADTTETVTFVDSDRRDRDATRESEYLYLDAIIAGEDVSAESKLAAENQKLQLVEKMEPELKLEGLIKAKGFEDAIVTIGDSVNVVVGVKELSQEEATQILSVIQDETEYRAKDVKIIPYN
ncbi:MAG: SpoIIIAH-like family protein [Clostridia bacterium]|nr:SpoIIIAH-like family protein [Clostridia bacterium]